MKVLTTLKTTHHELLQRYFDSIYRPFQAAITQAMHGTCSNEIYGEVYYYSAVKLLKYLRLSNQDHFLDIGSGLGKLALQTFITTDVAAVTGIEINQHRFDISNAIKQTVQQQLPRLFAQKKALELIHADFLAPAPYFDAATIAYVCSTAFSAQLLASIGTKLNTLPKLRQVISLRKLPDLSSFKLQRTMFLHCTWDRSPCYIYRKGS